MTKIKLCGLSTQSDIETINQLKPDYIGFVFAPQSRRYVSYQQASQLKEQLDPSIQAVGVFVDADIDDISYLLKHDVIDIIQLHGNEDETYIKKLQEITHTPILQAFQIKDRNDIDRANNSSADYILLDSGTGTGHVFDWEMIQGINRPYFLAGGLNLENIELALHLLQPYAVDVSSGIETNGKKDPKKMAEFIAKIRKEDTL